MYVATLVLTMFFRGYTQKKEVSPTVEKITIKHVCHASFVNHLCSVPPVKNFHNVAQNLPVGDIVKTSGKHGPPRMPAEE